MGYLRKWQLALVCLLALALLPFAPAPRGTAQATGYTVTDLGTLGGDASRAFGLDECGSVVGEAQAAAGAAAPFRPFRWSNGTMTDLGTLGGQGGTAYAINQTAMVIGSAQNSVNTLHAFVKGPADATPQDLGTLGGPTVEAYDINASVQIVGVSEESGGGSIQERAFLWQPGVGMVGLTAPWGKPIRAFGINDAGQIAGAANHNVSGTHAFVTIGGVAVDLGTLGGDVSFATEVNDVGEVAGYSHLFSNTITKSFHAFYWKDTNGNGQSDSGEMLDMGTLGGRHSYAYDINDSGLVVGRSETAVGSSATHAFIWSSTGGLQDLNNVVPGTGWTFQEAHAVNDRGQIVGFGLNPTDGKQHAFLLTPNDVGPSPCDATPTPTPVPGTLQFAAATYTVGEGGGSVIVSVSRTGGSDGAVSVNYATSTGGTATAGSDYVTTSGTVNFANGETTKTFPVTINEDTLDEPDETVNLALSSPAGGATLGAQNTAVLTITDNDPTPSLSINDVSVTEGNSGTVNATFTVTLSAASGQTVTVNYATADGTAVAPGDYTAITSTQLTYTPGQTSKTLDVVVTGDTTFESNETFFVNLTSPTGATIADSQGQGTITNDDASATSGLQYYPLAYPVRLLDTRAGFSACYAPGAPLAANASRTQPATGTCQGLNIPATAKAIVGNATVVTPAASGHITLYPSDAPLPTVSNLNYVAGQIVPNAFTVGLGADGAFKIFTPTSTHFIIDVAGYYAPPGEGGLYYHPLPRPVRLLDSRPGQVACDTPGAPLQAQGVRTESARLTCSGVVLPADAQAIVGNATVVNNSPGAADGHIILYPNGAAQPVVSNLNYVAGQIVPNAFTVGLGADGAFKIFSYTSTHFIVDVTGYYSTSAAADANGVAGMLFYPLAAPARLLDTRAGFTACYTPGAPLAGNSVRTQPAQGVCAGSTIPATALAIFGNATVVTPGGDGHIILYPNGAAQPVVSNLNYVAGQIVPNAFNVSLGTGGAFNIYTPTSTHFIIDVAGYFAP